MAVTRGLLIAVLALLVLGLAGASQASLRMYTGSLIIKSFGNDTSTGASFPYSVAKATGIPLINRCNTLAYHAQETVTFPTYPNGTQTIMFSVPQYGGQVPTIDTNGDTMPDVPPGCENPTLSAGDPLVGSGNLSTTGNFATTRTPLDPRGFALPKSALAKVRNGEATAVNTTAYVWEVHYADLVNQAGTFVKNGGDGTFDVKHAGVGGKRRATQTAGKNKFGGVMSLLGTYYSNEGYLYNGTVISAAKYTWLFDVLGHAGQMTMANVVTGGFNDTALNEGYTLTSGYPFTSMVYVEAFKWSTGIVKVTATGNYPTVLERKGYDKRNAAGSGAVQLVSPMLTKWVGEGTTHTAAIGMMKITVPEPSQWMMLAGGISMIGLLYGTNRRSRK